MDLLVNLDVDDLDKAIRDACWFSYSTEDSATPIFSLQQTPAPA